MKKLLRTMLCLFLTPLLLLAGCAGGSTTSENPGSADPSDTPSEEPKTPDPRAEAVWSSDYADGAN